MTPWKIRCNCPISGQTVRNRTVQRARPEVFPPPAKNGTVTRSPYSCYFSEFSLRLRSALNARFDRAVDILASQFADAAPLVGRVPGATAPDPDRADCGTGFRAPRASSRGGGGGFVKVGKRPGHRRPGAGRSLHLALDRVPNRRPRDHSHRSPERHLPAGAAPHSRLHRQRDPLSGDFLGSGLQARPHGRRRVCTSQLFRAECRTRGGRLGASLSCSRNIGRARHSERDGRVVARPAGTVPSGDWSLPGRSCGHPRSGWRGGRNGAVQILLPALSERQPRTLPHPLRSADDRRAPVELRASKLPRQLAPERAHRVGYGLPSQVVHPVFSAETTRRRG